MDAMGALILYSVLSTDGILSIPAQRERSDYPLTNKVNVAMKAAFTLFLFFAAARAHHGLISELNHLALFRFL